MTATAEGFDPAHPFGSSIARFDTAVDAAFERIRDNRAVDRVFYVASALADWSLIWHAIGATQAVADRRRRARHGPALRGARRGESCWSTRA